MSSFEWSPGEGPRLYCPACKHGICGQSYQTPMFLQPVCRACYQDMLNAERRRQVDQLAGMVPSREQFPSHCVSCGRDDVLLYAVPNSASNAAMCDRCLSMHMNHIAPGRMYVRVPIPRPISYDPARLPPNLDVNPYGLPDLPLNPPAGVKSPEDSTRPKVMRYMDREEVHAYVSAWLRWVGSLSMSIPTHHKMLRLGAPAEKPANPREEEKKP